jgi:hypothetical protein
MPLLHLAEPVRSVNGLSALCLNIALCTGSTTLTALGATYARERPGGDVQRLI